MKLGVMVDFDGTVTDIDSSYQILERFSDNDWYAIEKEALEGRITILEALDRQAKLVYGDPKEIRKHLVETVSIREGFREFHDHCIDNNIYLEICSDGFGFALGALLEEWGLEQIPWTSNPTYPSKDGMRIEFPYHRVNCPINANCKCSHLERLMKKYDRVIFVGDGTTDICVSRKAPILFARDELASICDKEGIPYHPWKSWSEILSYVREKVNER